MGEYSYDDLFARNIGIFTPEQQGRIREMTVAIAGVGGLGGSAAYSLCRLGVGRLHLADPETFDASNVNRQFGAYVDTVGVPKVHAVARELRRINPGIELQLWERPLDASSVRGFLKDADAVVDGLEFFELEAERSLHREAVSRGLWVFMLQGVGNVTSFVSFDPHGVTFEQMFVDASGHVELARLIRFMFPRLPLDASPADVAAVLSAYERGEAVHFPSYSVLAPMGGCFVVEDLVNVTVRERRPAGVAPSLYLLDLDDMSITHYEG